MNLQNIFNHLHSEDPEFYERTSERRSAIRTFMKGVALTAAPLALGGLLKKAYGQSATEAVDILNYALTLEHLEAEFYKAGVNNFSNIGVPSGAPQGAITTIRDHEVAHVAFLTTTIRNAGGTPISKTAANFDFSGGVGSAGGPGTGPFATVFSSYDVFLAVAQTFEDTGVRAYKGQAPRIISDAYNGILQAALQIHSVEARHAAHIRYMRSNRSSATNVGVIRPWITQAQSNITTGNAGVDALIQKSYAGENVTNQAGVDIAGFIGADLGTQSFDEPLDMTAVLDIVKPFIIS
ncbi:MAG: ferritin-like domain-containing protein [Sphingobacteriales bacterium]|nr:MAG: ferritin-like domain-containing protein [Sphingobacteriales bacterium]